VHDQRVPRVGRQGHTEPQIQDLRSRLRLVTVHRQNASELSFAPTPATIHRMLELLIVVVRALTLAFRGHRELVLENLALRQQLATFHRTTRCRLRARDRLFWMVDPRQNSSLLNLGAAAATIDACWRCCSY